MSLIKDLAKEKLLDMALHGCRAIFKKELNIPDTTFSFSSNYKQELIRKAQTESRNISYPISYALISEVAGIRDRLNNFAVKKHGIRFNRVGERATSKKGYLFSITIGLELHYIDSDPQRVLLLAQSLAILSSIGGLDFQIDIGDMYSIAVRLEIPPSTTISIQDEQDPSMPGANDITTQFVMHTQTGFFKDVSAVNGNPPIMNITLEGADGSESFEVEIP